MDWTAKWITPQREYGDVIPNFSKKFQIMDEIEKATLFVTALGTYEVLVNGQRVSDYVLAPGWTTYKSRLQYQEYDVTDLLQSKNDWNILVGKGWYRSNMSGRMLDELKAQPPAVKGELMIRYKTGREEWIVTDETWQVSESEIRFSEIYDGEICDARVTPLNDEGVKLFDGPDQTLIPQEGEKILEHERLEVADIITTPKGEVVLDFGQEITGYVEVTVEAKAGETVRLSHGEVLDKDGNFYNENYRTAKAQFHYICRDGVQTYHPRLTFYGFRYVRVEDFPGGISKVKPENFKAIAVYSDIKRTGYLSSSNSLLNKFFDNVIWGQKGNFLDIPTDCPQRNERLGWTGDAQVFIRAAAYNFDVQKFFHKWLGCLRADQLEDGYVGQMIPDTWQMECSAAGWGDAAIICPWELYRAYGDMEILKVSFPSMKKRIDYITRETKDEYLWTGGRQLADWLALDGEGEAAGKDKRQGGSRDDFVASAFYAYSTGLVVKIGKLLGEDVSEYENLYGNIVAKFQKVYDTYKTQTECVLAVHFGLTEHPKETVNQLAEMIRENGGALTTGFLGTPYLLHVLSDYGYSELAYDLLLREEYPSWLFSVKQGATTVWEHWDSLKEDGTFWEPSMNSFNHYAYGAVTDWVYGVAAGIQPTEEHPGYEKVRIAPIPTEKLDWLEARLDTRYGLVRSIWKKEKNFWRYEITTPVEAEIVIDGEKKQVTPGTYYFYSERKEGIKE